MVAGSSVGSGVVDAVFKSREILKQGSGRKRKHEEIACMDNMQGCWQVLMKVQVELGIFQ